jgi:hypothetical protein
VREAFDPRAPSRTPQRATMEDQPQDRHAARGGGNEQVSLTAAAWPRSHGCESPALTEWD